MKNSPIDGFSKEDGDLIKTHLAENSKPYYLRGSGGFAFVKQDSGDIVLCEMCDKIETGTSRNLGRTFLALEVHTMQQLADKGLTLTVTNAAHLFKA